jgi:hypothetical protein
MRNRVNIISRQPEITDEELERFRNFDSLLNKHYRILNEKKPLVWRIIVPALVLLGSIALYWLLGQNDSKLVNNNSSFDNVTVPHKPENEKIKTQPGESEKVKNESPERKQPNTAKAEVRNRPASVEPNPDT